MPDDFCNDPNVRSYVPNMALNDSYDNWVNRFDLTCAPKSKISLIGTAYFVGLICTMVILPRFSDLYGREKMLKVANLLSAIAVGIMIVTENYPMLIATMATLGATSTVSMQVMAIYMYENMNKVNYTNMMTVTSMGQGLVAVGVVVYFTYASKSALWLLLIAFMMQICGGMMSLFMYESPKFLIKSG